jgi:serine/threonine protein kinase
MAVLPAQSSSNPPTPLVVDRYAIYDEIASGGMATVHFARLIGAQGFRRTVAAKRLLPHLTRDHDFALMLIDEARLAARIRHPNVVSTLDVVATDNELILVMDYVHGESLAKLVRNAQVRNEAVPLPIVMAIMIDALHGLHAAHEARDERGEPLGIVHRDVSPQNLLVGTDGITRIADFGIAKAAGRTQTTRDGAVKGKLTYMAPEQLGAGDVTRTTDVFAASVVLWELLTGQRLFEGSTQAESVFKVMNAPIYAPSQLVGDVSSELDAIVMKGLERDATRRYPTARDMAQALESCAPPVRPAEIAAWVERIGGESLARRARLMALVEHAPDGGRRLEESGVPEAPLTPSRQPTVYSGPSLGSMDARTQFLEGSGTYARASRTGSSSVTPRRTRFGLVALAVLLVTAAVALVLFVVSNEPMTREADAPELAIPQLPGSVTPVPASSVSASSTSTPVVAAPAPGTEEPIADSAEVEEPDEEDARRPRSKKRSVRRSEPREKPKPDSSERAVRVNCDPPYSIDETGRRIFKMECM